MKRSHISNVKRTRIREQAGDRCGYCLSFQEYVLGPLEIEHIVPEARGGTNEEENLWLACRMCNSYKGVQVDAVDPFSGMLISLFNPRTQIWGVHFRWRADGTTIEGLTP